MTKKELKNMVHGKQGEFAYPNGNRFNGIVIIKSKEMVIDVLHINYTDIVTLQEVNGKIKIETKNGQGYITL